MTVSGIGDITLSSDDIINLLDIIEIGNPADIRLHESYFGNRGSFGPWKPSLSEVGNNVWFRFRFDTTFPSYRGDTTGVSITL